MHLILKKKIIYLLMEDIQLQAKKQSGKKFKIIEIPYVWPKDLLKNKILKLVLIQNYLQKIL